MTKYKIGSPLYNNIYLISQIEITNKTCTIHLNNIKEFQIPLLVAISYFSLISQMLLNDSLMTDFYVVDHLLDNIQENIIEKLVYLLNLQEIQLDNEEIIQLAKIGKVLGNNELIALYMDMINKNEQNLNIDNALTLIKQKLYFGLPIEELNSEISYISSNFSTFVDKLVELGNEIKYYNVIESIIKHENLTLTTEDELLEFIIKLCRQNRIYELLYEYVWLEYCSIESISNFIEYINIYMCKDNHFKSIIKCINKRLIQEQIPVKIQNEKRYKEIYNLESKYDFNENDPLNGLLLQENFKGNIDMNASSILKNYNIYDLIKNTTDTHFETQNEPNSWIEAKIKNNKSLTINRYVIRGHKYGQHNQLKSWKLEGRKVSNGEWIELDKHQNETFDKLVLKSFKIESKEKLDTIRLTQTETNTGGNNLLPLNAFEIYGNVYLH